MEGRLLVVDEDQGVRDRLGAALAMEGFEVVQARDAAGALRAVRDRVPELVLMAGRLPDGDGVDVMRRLRAEGTRGPIVLFGGRERVADRVACLEAGADDVLVTPVSVAEVVARVRALLRRRRDLPPPTVTRFADLSLDVATREVRRGGRSITLTRREFDLLAYLLANAGAALTRARILREAWGLEGSTSAVDVYVGYLRRKLEEGGAPRLVHTVRGVGYQLRTPPAATG